MHLVIQNEIDQLTTVQNSPAIKREYSKKFSWLDYPNKIRLAAQIADYIMNENEISCLLAHPQFGKTAIMQIILYLLSGESRRIVYVCSYNRNNFKRQVKIDFQNYENVLVIDPRKYASYKPAYKDIVIMDECHYGCTSGQTFDKHIWNKIKSRSDVYKLFVSATPFDLLAMGVPGAKVFAPTRGDLVGYLGFAEMLKAEDVSETFNLNELIYSMPNTSYGIIRWQKGLADGKTFDSTMRNLKALHPTTKFVAYIQESKIDDFYAETCKVNSVKTVYLIKENLRVGERIDNTHLFFTCDRLNGNIDTIAQSLVARACGNGKVRGAKHIANVTVLQSYVDMWGHYWNTGEMKLPEVTRLSKGTDLSTNRSDTERVFLGGSVSKYDSVEKLPDYIKRFVVKGSAQGRLSKNLTKEKVLSTLKVRSNNGTIQSKAYHGAKRTSDENLGALLNVWECYHSGEIANMSHFCRQGDVTAKSKELQYGVFFVQTNELEESHGIKDGTVLVLTKEGVATKIATHFRIAENTIYKELVHG